MDSIYLVRRVFQCPDCKYGRVNQRQITTEKGKVVWVDDKCSECRGTGEREEEVDLEEVLEKLGYAKREREERV